MRNRSNNEEFIRKSKIIHGDKYDYSLVEYINSTTPVKIICSVHGVFEQKPNIHIKGSNCPLCVRTKMTTEDFIIRAKEVHGDKYDYSKTNYVKSNIKVIIGCPKHQLDFYQTPNSHLMGSGCNLCGNESIASKSTMDNDEFIRRAKELHGNKYDYSKTNYIRNDIDVEIICPTHGSFLQNPGTHIRGNGGKGAGCSKCSGTYQYTTDEFIKKAIEVHGDKYDYTNTVYTNSKRKVEIICRKHGSFSQHAGSHLREAGCKVCNGGSQLTTEEFIKKAKEVHGEKYDYSETKYVKSNMKVTIRCPIHSYFRQIPNSHIQGSGCPRCGQIVTNIKQTLTTEDFLERAKKVHGDLYDYSKTVYVGIYEKIEIICKKHGSFFIQPNKHINSGQGCPRCVGKNRTTEDIVQEFRVVHGDIYDYSKVVYTGVYDKVEIICEKHGSFHQDPHHHLNSQTGCPKCNSSKGEDVIRTYLTNNSIVSEEQKRFKDCRYKNPLPFDFFLPDYNIAIEYDGEQHYRTDSHFYHHLTDSEKQSKLELTQLKDAIKTNYCTTNGIKLIRIPYWRKDFIVSDLSEAINNIEKEVS
jgi:very-short-patch-repair endonuclease